MKSLTTFVRMHKSSWLLCKYTECQMVHTIQKYLRPSKDTMSHSGGSDMSCCVKLWKFKDKNNNNFF